MGNQGEGLLPTGRHHIIHICFNLFKSWVYSQRKSVALTIKVFKVSFMHISSPKDLDLIHTAPQWEIIDRSLSNFDGFSIGLNPLPLGTCGEGQETIKHLLLHFFLSVYLCTQKSWPINPGFSLSLSMQNKSLCMLLIRNL